MADLLSAWLLFAFTTVVSLFEDRRGLFGPPSAAEYLLLLGSLWWRSITTGVKVLSEDEERRWLEVGVAVEVSKILTTLSASGKEIPSRRTEILCGGGGGSDCGSSCGCDLQLHLREKQHMLK
jgi:hypothetical protein